MGFLEKSWWGICVAASLMAACATVPHDASSDATAPVVIAPNGVAATPAMPDAQPIAAPDMREPAAAAKAAQADSASPDSPTEIGKIISETNHELAEQGGENDRAPLQIPMAINHKVTI